MKRYIILLALFILLLPVSCLKEDYKTSDCEISLELEYRWINTNPYSSNQILIISGAYTDTLRMNTDNKGATLKIFSGIYHLVTYEVVEGVSFDAGAGTVWINTAEAGETEEYDDYIPDISPFNAGEAYITPLTFVKDTTINMPVWQQTRDLIIKVILKGGGMNEVSAVSGVLDGVTLHRKINEGFVPEDGEPRHSAILSGKKLFPFKVGDQPNIFISQKTLLGIDGNPDVRQTLDLSLTLPGQVTTNVSFDVSEGLRYFHTDNVREPMVILLTVGIGIDYSITIEDWKWGTESELDAF